MHTHYRTALLTVLIGGALLAAVSLQAMAEKAITTQHTDGLPALITPECKELQHCQEIAQRSCPREFFQTLLWTEIQTRKTRWTARRMGDRDDPVMMHFTLTFRCYPSPTSVVVELIDGRDGLKIGPCVSESECDVFAQSLCPTGYLHRESQVSQRIFPPSLKLEPVHEALYWQIRCEAALENAE